MIIALATWMVGSAVKNILHRMHNRPNKLAVLRQTPRAYYGMLLAHIGLAVFLLGATFASTHSTERDVRMKPGDRVTIAGYDYRFEGVRETRGPNYVAEQGEITVFRNGQEYMVLKPQKRVYLVQRNPMTEAAIDPGLTRDLFVALGEPLGNGEWSMRIQHKPLIRWIWLGAVIMALGGLLAASDRRYRLKQKQTVVQERVELTVKIKRATT